MSKAEKCQLFFSLLVKTHTYMDEGQESLQSSKEKCQRQGPT
jgi:hypothetical protein